MQTEVKAKYIRIAPRKVRLVADMIRGKSVAEARDILQFTVKKGIFPIGKLLHQASKNIENTYHLDPLDFYISKITVDEGPKFKRWETKSRGQSGEIQKKTCHITIALSEGKQGAKKIEIKEAIKKERKEKAAKTVFKPQKEMAAPKKDFGAKKMFTRRKSI